MQRNSKNLLKNPCAKEGFDHWNVVQTGGNGFQCEEEPVGCKKICECTNVKENLPCWATSYGYCEKIQLVSLPECGISVDRLDEEKTPITIRDWYGARVDCGSQYKIMVRLLAEDKSTELDAWNFNDTKEKGSDWTKVKHVFENYPSGVRYVEFKHGGQDTNYWSGYYGVKMTNSGVFVGKEMADRAMIGKNLLKNPCAAWGLDYWNVLQTGGNGFQCEEEPIGCKKIFECTNVKENLPCWATSYGYCEKIQLVSLPECGISVDRLDEKKTPITIRDWYGARVDCGCQYKIMVRLLAEDKSTELDAWNFNDTKEKGSDWTKVKHVFENYPSGVRYVEFKHGGQDTNFWSGYYGVKMTNSGVFVGKKMESFV